MNSSQRQCVAMSLLLLAFGNAGAESWWTSDGAWCFHVEERCACLPETFEAILITEKKVKFTRTHRIEPAVFVEFYSSNLSERPRDTYIDPSFHLRSEKKTASAYVAEYVTEGSGSHSASVFEIVLDSSFTLLIYGEDASAVAAVAEIFDAQWADRGHDSHGGTVDDVDF